MLVLHDPFFFPDSAGFAPAGKPHRLVLVDDHPVFRAGLRRYLELQDGLAVIGDAPDIPGGLELAATLRPDLILLDYTLKDAIGLELLPLLRAQGLTMPVIVVSMHEDNHHVEAAHRAGAAAYAMKARGPGDLLAQVWRVLGGAGPGSVEV